jgi:hypothetical protein
MSDQGDDDGVVGRLRGFTWSNEAAAAYEAALDAINDAVGAYSALIAAEEGKPQPDPAVIEAARAGRTSCARRREALDPADDEQISRARREFTELARRVRTGRT